MPTPRHGRRATGMAVVALIGAVTLSLAPDFDDARRAAAQTSSTVVCEYGSGTPGLVDPTSFALAATEGWVSTPDGNSVYQWSYGIDPPGAAPADFQTPGPVLCVDEGDTVTITFTVAAGFPTVPPGSWAPPLSIVFPGQSGVTASGGTAGLLANETNGGTVTYSFVAGEPGTYLYESGSDPSLQIHMGLYGALIVYPTDGTAYGSGTAYNDASEYLLVLHEMDPDLHYAVENNTTGARPVYAPFDDPPGTTRHDRYWTINGRSMPDTLAPNFAPWLPDQPYSSLVRVEATDSGPSSLPALVRYANAGLDNHPFHPHGNHLQTIAQDGRLLNDGSDLSAEAFTKTIASGQTFDLFVRWVDVEGYDAGTNPVPVTIPNLQNLVFIDNATYYSGSPYLGSQGPFPAGVTEFNECGEYYFPWHSHALNEVQNFNEGFGGMLTLWRVDPQGGCP